jgi:hypothetical protein
VKKNVDYLGKNKVSISADKDLNVSTKQREKDERELRINQQLVGLKKNTNKVDVKINELHEKLANGAPPFRDSNPRFSPTAGVLQN